MAILKTEGEQGLRGTNRVVCHCYRVAESTIREAIDLYGSVTVSQVTQQTSAGGGCNACHCRIKRMLAGQRPTCSLFEVCNVCGFNSRSCDCEAA